MNTRKPVSGKARKPSPAAPKKGAPAASAKGKSAASAKNAKPTRPEKDAPAKKSSTQPAEKEVSARDKRKYIDFKEKVKKGDPLPSFNEEEIRLNKYLSNAGICSRREADVLIQTGVVSINGEIVTELGYKIKPGDVVRYDGETINAETKRYVLLNKPKGFITTMDDPFGRKTVMGLVRKACRERVYPVGRLDRETTGLLLFTNDGDMAKKLTHPKHRALKIYHAELNKPVSREHLQQLLKGIDLEDGRTNFDAAEYVKEGNSREVGVEIHSGKNRIVRRMFEALGYDVVKLDRVQFAGLTKKDLPRGMYRHLTEKEVSFLKMS
ncbi:MAG: rRNA pseudouridine synthase [Cryomorphaceae bacterium]|nr:rRNA pseudouridine synthase [Cryomorphaceae bacterium]